MLSTMYDTLVIVESSFKWRHCILIVFMLMKPEGVKQGDDEVQYVDLARSSDLFGQLVTSKDMNMGQARDTL